MRYNPLTVSIATSAFFVLSVPVGAIDLTPHYLTTFAEGVSISRPYFTDGDKKYAITLDGETELVASSEGALFKFQKFPTAIALLRQSPMEAKKAFDEAHLPSYLETARFFVPGDAKQLLLEHTDMNVFPINGWQSCRLTFRYDLPNVSVRHSITFLNIDPKQQIVLEIKATAELYETIAARTFDMVRRWHELQDGADKRPN
jgi:hypothetical protein